MRRLKIASKTFIFGEYLALIGGPSLVLAHDPSFEVEAETNSSLSFHPESAIARWCSRQSAIMFLPKPFQHPLKLGGLGLSSAEFLAAYFLNRKTVDPWLLLEEYRALFKIPPSGYDILAQLTGGLAYIHGESKILHHQMTWPFRETGFVVIATHKKLATHQHVHQISLKQKALALAALGQELSLHWQQNKEAPFYQALNNWRFQLMSLGLEDASTTQIIERLMKIDGVLCAKGCGAMGTDMIFAIYNKQSTFLTQLQELAYDVVTDESGIAQGLKELTC